MTFLERYKAGDRVAVWGELMALGEGVRDERYYADAWAVAVETMRRARHNVELLIQRLDASGYRFQDRVSSAEDQLSRFDVMGQLSAQIENKAASGTATRNVHVKQMMENLRELQAKVAPLLQKASARAAKEAAAKRKPPLEDPQVFSPADTNTPRLVAKLEKMLKGPLPLSLRAWYEQVGGVSLMGSHAVFNAVDFSSRGILRQFGSFATVGAVPAPAAGEEYAPDPLVVYPIEELLDQLSGREDDEEGDDGGKVQLVISPDELQKANISGDARYIALPDARADFEFDDSRKGTFVNHLRVTFQWGGFPGWERLKNAPRAEIAELSEDLLPL